MVSTSETFNPRISEKTSATIAKAVGENYGKRIDASAEK